MKLLIGGSPCTHWSIAQTKNRETEASGIGWELFLNYRIARDKYQPDFFLYENNKSMAPAIKAQISKELGVEPVLINSALVSAQNRQRLYWAGRRNPDSTYSQAAVEQPEDMGILLRDILESGVCWREKAYTLKANYFKSSVTNAMDGGHFPSPMAAEPIIVNGMESGKARTVDAHMGKLESNLVPRINNPNPAKQQYDCIAVPVPEPVNETVDVIAHIMSHFTGLTEEPVEVLSMYDGMSCGHIALDKLGAEITAYYATEIDKYAIQTTQHNYPETVQLGDAFQVRDEEWSL